MKITILGLILSFGAMANAPEICNFQNVGKACYVGNGQKEIVGECVHLRGYYNPSCLIVDCAEKLDRTLNLNCKRSESESGICLWPQGFAYPQCI